MDKYLASKIVNQYVDAIENDTTAFKKISTLMFSKEKIEEAFFVFMEEYIKLFRLLGWAFGAELIAWFCMMDLFIEDNKAERWNQYLETGLTFLDKHPQAEFEQTLARMLRLSKAIHDGLLSKHPKINLIREALIKYATDSRNGVYFDEINEHYGRCAEKYIPKDVVSSEQKVEETVKRVRSELAINNIEWWKIHHYDRADNYGNKKVDENNDRNLMGVVARKLILKLATETKASGP